MAAENDDGRRRRARKLPAAVRSEAIVEAAIAAFSRTGYYGTSARAVAAEAGVSEPTVFQYYKTKKELYVAALTAASLPIFAFWQEVVSRPEDPIKRLQTLSFQFLDQILADPAKPQLLFGALSTKGDADIEAFVKMGQETFHAFVAQILREGVEQGIFRRYLDVSNEAWRFLGLGVGICMLALLDKQDELNSPSIWRWGDAFRDSILNHETR
ncbi:MAG: TetR/AcrR family transcriptional regulator [Candidatus Methylomirabilis sp.]|nr:TetR/AcrR family transcriptional regulator [Deltaproteobacteria bacterium]